ncbi:MAG: thymidylate synthase [Candidatus Kapaibacterium sp.]
MTNNANQEWLRLLEDVLSNGERIRPRGKLCYELRGYQTKIDMRFPVVSVKYRKMGYKFMTAEAAWILSGDNRLENIKKYSPFIWEFSDDGHYYSGAYGPMIVDQLTYVVDMLEQDPDTRQAVLTIWRPNPRPSRDIPCTVSLQWFIRDGKLHCHDTMRSSDCWLGWVYDVFNMTMITGMILLLLRERKRKSAVAYAPLELGDLVLTAGSAHIYDKNYNEVHQLLSGSRETKFDAEFMPYEFENASHLIAHLQALSDKNPVGRNLFLSELNT